jgi:hypothetical protein
MAAYRSRQLQSVVQQHFDMLEGDEFVAELVSVMTSEVDAFAEQIVSYADNKKANLDAAAAEAA